MSKRLNHSLDTLLMGLVDQVPKVSVSGLCLDSRALRPGDLFVAVAGHQQHGLAFLDAAIASGAAAVLWEQTTDDESGFVELAGACPIPQVGLPQLGDRLGLIADRFYDYPAEKISIIGVTGTNGKSSICHFITQALNGRGIKCAMMGTLGNGLPGAIVPSLNTTSDAISVRQHLYRWAAEGVKYAAMEVSSHALVQGRLTGLRIPVVIFTNLSRDHLDYHQNMQAYGQAKASLMQQPGIEVVVRNLDDAWAVALHTPTAAGAVDFAIDNDDAPIRASGIRAQADGVSFKLHIGDATAAVEAPLSGLFNVQNMLAVAAFLHATGWEAADIQSSLSALTAAPGRMSRLPSAAGKPGVVVDYAHTPDALAQALGALRQHTRGDLWCVFGCGGDRDRGKRPLMAQAAERLADRVLVTTDNPRTEAPEQIVKDIVSGFEKPEEVLVELDRARAIATAINRGLADDQILVAGKGHELYQDVDGERLAFDDWACAAQALGVAA